ncbi:hypothetical protein L0Y65_00230 [Candidatus Micrarchaeota archaeon]|nr:hypothetical protein [Candidatus Micrarchaeota archaeon]
MDAKRPGEGPPSPASSALRGNCGDDEAASRSVAEQVVESLRKQGRYSVLINLSKDARGSSLVAEEARKNIMAAALIACDKCGSLHPLIDVAIWQDVPLETARHAGEALVMRYSEPYEELNLFGILKDQKYHDEARVKAGKAIISHAENTLGFSSLCTLATGADIIYDVKKPAGFRLIQLAVELGNYPVLLALEKQKNLPVDVRIALEGQAPAAAEAAIRLAYAANDFAILTDISEDVRLSDQIRAKASGCVHELTKPAPRVASPDGPDPQMAAELMNRLGKGAGTIRSEATLRSSAAPLPSSERPTQKEPLSRPKR